MEALAELIGGFLGLIGAFAGVWLANRYQSRAERQQVLRDTTISLYTELTSVEMLTSRMKASRILDEIMRKQGKLTITELATKVDTDFEDWFHVGRVLTFFQKLGLYLQAGYLDEELARELMGDLVMLWYDHYLSHLVRDVDIAMVGCNAAIANDTLEEWLKPYRAQLEAAQEREGADEAGSSPVSS